MVHALAEAAHAADAGQTTVGEVDTMPSTELALDGLGSVHTVARVLAAAIGCSLACAPAVPDWMDNP